MTPAPPTRTRAPEIRALTGARGIPVLLIVLFHFHEWHGYSGVAWYGTLASKGYIWVEFFFALSGFILFYAYGAQFGARLRAEALWSFLAARVSRIYPRQVATILAVIIECPHPERSGAHVASTSGGSASMTPCHSANESTRQEKRERNLSDVTRRGTRSLLSKRFPVSGF